jgi:carbonic anhydrase
MIIKKEEAYSLLNEGNNRFVTNKRKFDNLDKSRLKNVSVNGQQPYATIVSCSDSRVPVEHIFDAGIGELFVVRVAGNVCGSIEIASVEYAVEHLVTPLLLVLGHTKCGAVTAVSQSPGHLTGNMAELASCIIPAVNRTKTKFPGLHGDDFVSKCVIENVWVGIQDLFKKSPIIQKFAQKGYLLVVGGVYDLDTGVVVWLGQDPRDRM